MRNKFVDRQHTHLWIGIVSGESASLTRPTIFHQEDGNVEIIQEGSLEVVPHKDVVQIDVVVHQRRGVAPSYTVHVPQALRDLDRHLDPLSGGYAPRDVAKLLAAALSHDGHPAVPVDVHDVRGGGELLHREAVYAAELEISVLECVFVS